MEGSPLVLFGTDEELRYAWVVNVHSPWSEEMLIGRTDLEVLGSEGEAITAAKRRVLRTGRTETVELKLNIDRHRYWYEVTLKRQTENGRTAILGAALDISDKKRREVMLQALLREVSHRSKNLLSMVLSIASQTSRKSVDKQTFLNRFTGRIQSISRSQDSITGSDWRGASLSELVASQVLGQVKGRSAPISVSGPDLYLTPNATLHVGLALHELTSNAFAHGALLGDRGQVEIKVEPPGRYGEPAVLEWRELGIGDGTLHREDSFGMMTLKRIVPAAVNGEARLSLDERGLVYRLAIDAGEFEKLDDRLSA